MTDHEEGNRPIVRTHYWLFVIDTNAYAGNFEVELCAFTTGHTVSLRGDKERKAFFDDGGNSDDYLDCRAEGFRQYATCETEKHSLNGVGIYFSERPHHLVIQDMKERAHKYAELNNLEILGFRMLRYDYHVHLEEV